MGLVGFGNAWHAISIHKYTYAKQKEKKEKKDEKKEKKEKKEHKRRRRKAEKEEKLGFVFAYRQIYSRYSIYRLLAYNLYFPIIYQVNDTRG